MKKSGEEELEFKAVETSNYNTIIIGGSGKSAEVTPKRNSATLISLLTDTNNRNLKEEVLEAIKTAGEKGKELLLKVISDPSHSTNRQILVAACWEADLDFSSHLDFFVDLAIGDKDYGVAVEALSVIDNITGEIPEGKAEENIQKIQKAMELSEPWKAELLRDLVTRLKN